MTWRRGCEIRGSKHDGCEEYKWDGGNVTVVECICTDVLCNKNVPDIPTTTPGNFPSNINIFSNLFSSIFPQCQLFIYYNLLLVEIYFQYFSM